jgi:hypothetical protein
LTRERFSVISLHEFFSLSPNALFVGERKPQTPKWLIAGTSISEVVAVASTAHMPNVIFLPFR